MPRPRNTRRRLTIGLGGAAATLVATAGIALAQAIPNPPDGGPPQPAGPNVITTACGPNQTSIIKTEDSPTATSSVNRVTLPGAATQITVPDGQTRCVKVLFTAESACQGPNPDDLCYVAATIDGAPMNPVGGGFQALDSEDGTASAHFEFPQDARRRAAWTPRLSDFLYVSLTNAIAVSPTDTMPLTHRAKSLMAVESLISYAIAILVVARAVNVLGTST